MKGGKINNNQGQGLYIRSSSSKMSGGEISGNEGNGVNILYGVFTLSGGCIAKNNSSESGGGIKIEGKTGKSVLNISGGVIRNNTTAMEGGGICSTGGDVKLVISGGEITGNTAAKKAGGVCLSKNNKFSGSPVISGNHSGKGNAIIDSNCVIEDGQKIIVVGALDRSARIGVTKLDMTYSSVFTKGLGASGNISAFFSDDPDYEIKWSDDGKEAMLVKTRVSLSECKFTVKDQVYTGKALTPAVTVKYGKKTLKQDTDYTLAYKNNKNVGVATVTVTGMGGYTGTKNLNFKILPRKNVISKVSVKDNIATLTLKRRAEATGYQVQYGLKSNFAAAKSITVKQAKTVKATLKSLKAGKTYYVRVRTYKTVGKKTYYSAWSGKKSIKVK